MVDFFCIDAGYSERLAVVLQDLEAAFDDEALRDRNVQLRYRDSVLSVNEQNAREVLAFIHANIIEPPYFTLIRGMPPSVSRSVLVGFTAALGVIEEPYSQRWSRVVREIRPKTDRRSPHAGILNQLLHTDGTDWPDPNDLTCLFCVTSDQNGGGESRLLPIEGVVRALEGNIEGQDALAYFRAHPVAWKLAPEFGGGVCTKPVLEGTNLRWLRFSVEEALAEAPNDQLCAHLKSAETAIEATEDVIHFAMEPGDLLIVNNKRALHARTAIPASDQSERLILRTKVRWNTTTMRGAG